MPRETLAPNSREMPAVTLGTGQVFVLDDNRDDSADSRSSGPISAAALLGRVEFLWFAMSGWSIRWDRFPRPLEPP
jgi:type IV secretory pathway protease TraF